MKHKLIFEYDYSFLLFGISCHDASYRLCWFLNKTLNLRMGLIDDHIVPQRKGNSAHLHYAYDAGEDRPYWTLLANHSTEGILVPELKQFDYLLKVEDSYQTDIPTLLEKIRSIPTVNACYEFQAEQLKHKDNLILH